MYKWDEEKWYSDLNWWQAEEKWDTILYSNLQQLNRLTYSLPSQF